MADNNDNFEFSAKSLETLAAAFSKSRFLVLADIQNAIRSGNDGDFSFANTELSQIIDVLNAAAADGDPDLQNDTARLRAIQSVYKSEDNVIGELGNWATILSSTNDDFGFVQKAEDAYDHQNGEGAWAQHVAERRAELQHDADHWDFGDLNPFGTSDEDALANYDPNAELIAWGITEFLPQHDAFLTSAEKDYNSIHGENAWAQHVAGRTAELKTAADEWNLSDFNPFGTSDEDALNDYNPEAELANWGHARILEQQGIMNWSNAAAFDLDGKVFNHLDQQNPVDDNAMSDRTTDFGAAFLNASEILYNERNGPDAWAQHVADEGWDAQSADEELASAGEWEIGWFEDNLTSAGKTFFTMSDKGQVSLLYLQNLHAYTEGKWYDIGPSALRGGLDPTMWLAGAGAVASGGTAAGATFGARIAAQIGMRKTVNSLLTRQVSQRVLASTVAGVVGSSIEGATSETALASIEQNLQIEHGLVKEFDFSKLTKRAIMGGVMGGAFGGVMGGGGRILANKFDFGARARSLLNLKTPESSAAFNDFKALMDKAELAAAPLRDNNSPTAAQTQAFQDVTEEILNFKAENIRPNELVSLQKAHGELLDQIGDLANNPANAPTAKMEDAPSVAARVADDVATPVEEPKATVAPTKPIIAGANVSSWADIPGMPHPFHEAPDMGRHSGPAYSPADSGRGGGGSSSKQGDGDAASADPVIDRPKMTRSNLEREIGHILDKDGWWKAAPDSKDGLSRDAKDVIAALENTLTRQQKTEGKNWSSTPSGKLIYTYLRDQGDDVSDKVLDTFRPKANKSIDELKEDAKRAKLNERIAVSGAKEHAAKNGELLTKKGPAVYATAQPHANSTPRARDAGDAVGGAQTKATADATVDAAEDTHTPKPKPQVAQPYEKAKNPEKARAQHEKVISSLVNDNHGQVDSWGMKATPGRIVWTRLLRNKKLRKAVGDMSSRFAKGLHPFFHGDNALAPKLYDIQGRIKNIAVTHADTKTLKDLRSDFNELKPDIQKSLTALDKEIANIEEKIAIETEKSNFSAKMGGKAGAGILTDAARMRHYEGGSVFRFWQETNVAMSEYLEHIKGIRDGIETSYHSTESALNNFNAHTPQQRMASITPLLRQSEDLIELGTYRFDEAAKFFRTDIAQYRRENIMHELRSAHFNTSIRRTAFLPPKNGERDWGNIRNYGNNPEFDSTPSRHAKLAAWLVESYHGGDSGLMLDGLMNLYFNKGFELSDVVIPTKLYEGIKDIIADHTVIDIDDPHFKEWLDHAVHGLREKLEGSGGVDGTRALNKKFDQRTFHLREWVTWNENGSYFGFGQRDKFFAPAGAHTHIGDPLKNLTRRNIWGRDNTVKGENGELIQPPLMPRILPKLSIKGDDGKVKIGATLGHYLKTAALPTAASIGWIGIIATNIVLDVFDDDGPSLDVKVPFSDMKLNTYGGKYLNPVGPAWALYSGLVTAAGHELYDLGESAFDGMFTPSELTTAKNALVLEIQAVTSQNLLDDLLERHKESEVNSTILKTAIEKVDALTSDATPRLTEKELQDLGPVAAAYQELIDRLALSSSPDQKLAAPNTNSTETEKTEETEKTSNKETPEEAHALTTVEGVQAYIAARGAAVEKTLTNLETAQKEALANYDIIAGSALSQEQKDLHGQARDRLNVRASHLTGENGLQDDIAALVSLAQNEDDLAELNAIKDKLASLEKEINDTITSFNIDAGTLGQAANGIKKAKSSAEWAETRAGAESAAGDFFTNNEFGKFAADLFGFGGNGPTNEAGHFMRNAGYVGAGVVSKGVSLFSDFFVASNKADYANGMGRMGWQILAGLASFGLAKKVFGRSGFIGGAFGIIMGVGAAFIAFSSVSAAQNRFAGGSSAVGYGALGEHGATDPYKVLEGKGQQRTSLESTDGKHQTVHVHSPQDGSVRKVAFGSDPDAKLHRQLVGEAERDVASSNAGVAQTNHSEWTMGATNIDCSPMVRCYSVAFTPRDIQQVAMSIKGGEVPAVSHNDNIVAENTYSIGIPGASPDAQLTVGV